MQNIIPVVVLVFILILVLALFKKKKQKTLTGFPSTFRDLLLEHVNFYKQLNAEKRSVFENRMQLFLSRVRITGIQTTVEDLDKILIAASAIIPIFGFEDWEYINLNEVLLYPDNFNHENFAEDDRNTLGVVGTGPYQNIMILSKRSLRAGFQDTAGKENVGIHEFVHLIDKTDGEVDGIPEFMLNKQFILPWLQLIRKEMQQIISNNSDINPYGTTNQAEFFAVVSEYFFNRPDLLQQHHPELYNLLSTIFRQQPK